MILPSLHINGTSAAVLRETHEFARARLDEAIAAILATEPNGRDYYPQGPEAFRQAQQEFRERMKRLYGVVDELLAVISHIDEHSK